MSWDSDDLDRIAGSEELQVSSYRSDGTLRRWTPIWVVRIGDDLFVRSAYGPDGGWYRNAMRHRRARIRAGDVETDVGLEPVETPAVDDEVSSAYRAKYHAQASALRPMIEAPAVETTVRLVPS